MTSSGVGEEKLISFPVIGSEGMIVAFAGTGWVCL